MTAAIFALGGVIVGGLLQGFMADLLERRRARRDARAAARLLHLAMLESSVQLSYTIGDDGWPAIIGRQLVPDEWMEHREVLARTLERGHIQTSDLTRPRSASSARVRCGIVDLSSGKIAPRFHLVGGDYSPPAARMMR